MHPDLQKRFDDLEVCRAAYVDRVRAMPADKQKERGPGGSFSPLEVVKHFAIAESGNNGFLRKAPPPTLKGRKVKYGFAYKNALTGMQNPTKPIGTPPMFVPKGQFTLDDADREWANARKELAGYLEQAETPDAPFIKFLFFFGILSAADYLEFTEAHMTYHESRTVS